MAAPADIASFSSTLICSILKASTVISCVAEAMATIKPIPITRPKLFTGSTKFQKSKQIKMIDCIKKIHDFLCPIFFVK